MDFKKSFTFIKFSNKNITEGRLYRVSPKPTHYVVFEFPILNVSSPKHLMTFCRRIRNQLS